MKCWVGRIGKNGGFMRGWAGMCLFIFNYEMTVDNFIIKYHHLLLKNPTINPKSYKFKINHNGAMT